MKMKKTHHLVGLLPYNYINLSHHPRGVKSPRHDFHHILALTANSTFMVTMTTSRARFMHSQDSMPF